MFCVLTREYACSGMSTRTPLGMSTNDPPLLTALLSAENLVSSRGMTVPKYSRNDVRMCPCPQRGVHVENDHARLRPLLVQAVLADLALVLGADTGQVFFHDDKCLLARASRQRPGRMVRFIRGGDSRRLPAPG